MYSDNKNININYLNLIKGEEITYNYNLTVEQIDNILMYIKN